MTREVSERSASAVIELGPYRLDCTSRTVYLHGERVAVKPRVFDFAAVLFENAGTIVSRAELYASAWGREYEGETRTVEVHMSWLRKALRLDGTHGWRLHGVRQKGYRVERAEPRRRLVRSA
jgi:two-component system response regulator RegX3